MNKNLSFSPRRLLRKIAIPALLSLAFISGGAFAAVAAGDTRTITITRVTTGDAPPAGDLLEYTVVCSAQGSVQAGQAGMDGDKFTLATSADPTKPITKTITIVSSGTSTATWCYFKQTAKDNYDKPTNTISGGNGPFEKTTKNLNGQSMQLFAAASTSAVSASTAQDGANKTVFSNIYTAPAGPVGGITINVKKEFTGDTYSGTDEFDVRVVCRSTGIEGGTKITARHLQFKLTKAAPTATFTHPGDEAVYCYTRERLTRDQAKNFTYKFSPPIVAAKGSAATVDGQTLTITNTYSTVSQNVYAVKKVVVGGEAAEALGPFDVRVSCPGAGVQTFSMDNGDTEYFQFPENRNMRCVVREVLTAEQRGFFKVLREDTETGTGQGIMSVAATASPPEHSFTVTNTYFPNKVRTFKVKKVVVGTPPTEIPASFPITVRCRTTGGTSETHELELQNGEEAEIQIESTNGTSPSRSYCVAIEKPTTEQRRFFKITRSSTDTARSNTSSALFPTTAAADAEHTATITNTYTSTGVETFSVNKVVDGTAGGDALGPFQVNVACNNGDRHYFGMYSGDVETFQYDAGKAMRCVVREVLTAEQRGFFKVKREDTETGTAQGIMYAANSSTIADSSFTVTNTYFPEKVRTFKVKKVVVGSPPASIPASFPITVRCRTTGGGTETVELELQNGEEDEVQIESRNGTSPSRSYCVAIEKPTAEQRRFFKIARTSDEPTRTNRSAALYPTTAAADAEYTATITNTYTPTQVETFEVKKVMDAGGETLAPFQINVACSNGDRHSFDMYNGETETFQYDANRNMRCRVSETLDPATQKPVFKAIRGDTQGASTGVIYGNSTAIVGSQLSVTNTYYPAGVNTINVNKVVVGGPVPDELNDFDIKVRCRTAGTGFVEHSLSLAGGESAAIQVEKDKRTYCVAIETLTDTQKPYFKMKREDNQGVSSGTILYAANSTQTDGTMTVTNTYVPTKVNTFNVQMFGTRSAADTAAEPFAATVTCSNGDSYNFELNPGETAQFQYEAGKRLRCRITEVLSGTQVGQYTIKRGDTLTHPNGVMLALSDTAVLSDNTACGQVLPAGTFCINNIPQPDTDGDGLSNIEEAYLGTDPNKADSDGDGLTDGEEHDAYKTNPLNKDTDGDGVIDGQETALLNELTIANAPASELIQVGDGPIIVSNDGFVAPRVTQNIPVFGPLGLLASIFGLLLLGRRRKA